MRVQVLQAAEERVHTLTLQACNDVMRVVHDTVWGIEGDLVKCSKAREMTEYYLRKVRRESTLVYNTAAGRILFARVLLAVEHCETWKGGRLDEVGRYLDENRSNLDRGLDGYYGAELVEAVRMRMLMHAYAVREEVAVKRQGAAAAAHAL